MKITKLGSFDKLGQYYTSLKTQLQLPSCFEVKVFVVQCIAAALFPDSLLSG